MRINREELLNQISSVMPGLAAREVHTEQSSCFVFKDKTVMTYNDEIACSHASCLHIEGAVEALPLVAILRKLTEKELEVKIEENELLIKGKNKRVGIKLESEIVLPVDAVDMPKKWKDLPDDFADAISIVQQCAGSDITKFALTCVQLHPKWIQACDSYQAARYKMKLNIHEPTLVRKESIKYIVSLDMSKFGETENWIHFKNSTGLVLSCKRWVEEDFPKISKLLKREGIPIPLPKGLAEAAEKAAVFSVDNVEDDEVSINLKDDKIKIIGRGASGYYQEVKKIKYKGHRLDFKIAPKLLINLIHQHNACEIAANMLKIKTGKYTYITVLTAPDDEK